LEAVGAVLRHRSPETTAIYAKVDTTMLSQVAQPWIGSVTCP
jgi:integrase/recombinase XerD